MAQRCAFSGVAAGGCTPRDREGLPAPARRAFSFWRRIQLGHGVVRIRVQAFGLRKVGSRSSMKSKLTVPNVVCGFFNAEQVCISRNSFLKSPRGNAAMT